MRYAIFLILFSACSYEPDAFENQTVGSQGIVRFSYGAGLECLFGCDLDLPMLVGSEERIDMESPTAVPLTDIDLQFVPDGVAGVVTLDEVGSEPSQRSVNIQSLAVGNTVLHILNQDGTLLDYVAVEVAEVANIALRFELNGSSEPIRPGKVYELPSGRTGLVYADLFDELERPLTGTTGTVSWTLLEGENVVALRNPVIGELSLEAVVLAVDALGLGTAQIQAEAHGVQVKLEIRVN